MGIQGKYTKKVKSKTAELANALPWAYCIKRYEYITESIKIEMCVVVHKDGCLQQSFGFRGSDLDSFSAPYINSVSQYFNEAVKRLGDGWMVSVEGQRFLTSDYPSANYEIEAGYLVDLERKDNFEGYGEHFDSSYYLNFVYKPDLQIKSKALKVFFTEVQYEKAQEEEIEKFLKETKRLTGVLETKLLIRPLSYKETVEYLHSTVSLRRHEICLPEHFLFLDSFVSDMTLHIGQTLKLDDYYIPILVINDFPMETYPSILHELNKTYIEYRWVSRFFPMEKTEAMKELDKWQGKHHGARKSTKQLMMEMSMNIETHKENVGAGELEADVGEAMKELTMDYIGFGYYNSVIMVWDLDFEKAMAKLAALRTVIEGCGFTCKEETFNAYSAFLGMCAGDVYRNIRRPLISTGNFAHVLPLSAVWAGLLYNKFTHEVCGIDVPLVTCSTNYGTPFFLNLNDGDVGHTLIFGPTGAGKSTLLMLLAISYLKYPDAQVFIIDKGASALTMTLAVGGEYVDPSMIKSCFQPLGDLETQHDKEWACEFIETLCEMQGVTVTPKMLVAIRVTIDGMALLDKELRTLTTFKLNCMYRDVITGNNTIDDAIQPYTLDGPYGEIFDGDRTHINESKWVLFEMSELMEMKEKVVAPAIMFIFHFLEKKFNGQMTLLIIDEAWRFLAHEIFMNKMRQWLKELRKKHVFCVFATQEVADGAKSPIASTLIQNCPTKIYLADPESHSNADAYERFGLTGDEIQMLSLARKKRDYYYKSPAGTRLFQLSLGPITLGLMRGQDQLVKTPQNGIVKWNEYCQYLLYLRNEKGVMKGFVEEVLDMQGIEFREYLEGTVVDAGGGEGAAEDNAV
jgi:type IV secretion system protein VirB4